MIKIYNTGIKLKIKGEDVDVNTKINKKQLKEIVEIIYEPKDEAGEREGFK